MNPETEFDLVGNLKFAFLIIFSYGSVLFFMPTKIPQNLLFYSFYGLFGIALLITLIFYKSSYNNFFTFPVLLFLIAVIISGLSATLYWGQDLYNSIKALMIFLCYIIFFLISIFNLPYQKLERIIIILGISYVVVYFITFLLFPRPTFGDINRISNERGFQRITLPGMGFLFLLTFYSLNKFFSSRETKWLILYFITFVCVLMSLTRTLIFASFVVSALYILRNSSFIKKILAILLIGFFTYFVSQLDFFQILLKQTQSQTKNFQDDVRMKAVYYYLSDFSPNTFTKIFGNGQAYGKTEYGRFVDKIERGYGYFAVDIGYIGLYTKFGILAILAYLLILIGTLKIKVPDEYLYCKYYLYYVFAISVIIDSTFDSGYIIPISFCIYIIATKGIRTQAVKQVEVIAS
jgi:hypothetical protein